MRTVFLLVAFFDCAILIPTNISYNLKFVDPSERDVLSMLTIRDIGGSFLWAHVAISYTNTAIVIIVVWFNWRAMVRLRKQYFLSPEYALSSNATLTVMHIPNAFQSDKGIKALFHSVQVPCLIDDVHIGRRVANLPDLIKVHNKTVREFEQILVRYLKGGKIGKKRPTIRVGGFLGIGGELREDRLLHVRCLATLISYLRNLSHGRLNSERLKETEEAVKACRARIDTHVPENYGFVSMPAVPCAHIVAEQLEHQRPNGAKVIPTPNLDDIVSIIIFAFGVLCPY